MIRPITISDVDNMANVDKSIIKECYIIEHIISEQEQLDFFDDKYEYDPYASKIDPKKKQTMDKAIPSDLLKTADVKTTTKGGKKIREELPINPIFKSAKTIMTADFSTVCPKHLGGRACSYCYVDDARNLRCNAKLMFAYAKYDDQLSKLKPSMIALLNSVGGIRLFSFGDYVEGPRPAEMEDTDNRAEANAITKYDTKDLGQGSGMDDDIQAFLDSCIKYGLLCKVITKVPSFIHKYHDHPAISIINISIDNISTKKDDGQFQMYGISWGLAKSLRNKYPKVRIRCVCMNNDDVNELLSISDVVTLNHAIGLKHVKTYKKDEQGNYLYKKNKSKRGKSVPILDSEYSLEDELYDIPKDHPHRGDVKFKEFESKINEEKSIRLYNKSRIKKIAEYEAELSAVDMKNVELTNNLLAGAQPFKEGTQLTHEQILELGKKLCCVGGKCVQCPHKCIGRVDNVGNEVDTWEYIIQAIDRITQIKDRSEKECSYNDNFSQLELDLQDEVEGRRKADADGVENMEEKDKMTKKFIKTIKDLEQ